MAPRLRSAVLRFGALPEPAWRVIMLALPVDDRARAACVCRAWRAFLADVSLWQVLDVSRAGGVLAERVTENLVRGAAARAGGRLRELSFSRVEAWQVADTARCESAHWLLMLQRMTTLTCSRWLLPWQRINHWNK